MFHQAISECSFDASPFIFIVLCRQLRVSNNKDVALPGPVAELRPVWRHDAAAGGVLHVGHRRDEAGHVCV